MILNLLYINATNLRLPMSKVGNNNLNGSKKYNFVDPFSFLIKLLV